MIITIQPTNQVHFVTTLSPDHLPYARLWTGTDQDGHEVQALIFGLALAADANQTQAKIDLAAIPPPHDFTNAWPPTVPAPIPPSDYPEPQAAPVIILHRT